MASNTFSRSTRLSLNSVLRLAVPLLIFCIIPLAFNRLSTMLAPFSLSTSVTFGSSGPSVFDNTEQPSNPPVQTTESRERSERYVSKKIVLGIFLSIFLAQVGVSIFHFVRTRRRKRIQAMDLQFPQPLPRRNRTQNWRPGPDARGDATPDESEGLPAPGLAHGA